MIWFCGVFFSSSSLRPAAIRQTSQVSMWQSQDSFAYFLSHFWHTATAKLQSAEMNHQHQHQGGLHTITLHISDGSSWAVSIRRKDPFAEINGARAHTTRERVVRTSARNRPLSLSNVLVHACVVLLFRYFSYIYRFTRFFSRAL